jgi:NAD(P)-dependent dehydrogenase (short-subunit alcohol dehydrogenase family)
MEGRVALITAAGSGMGRAGARLLAAEGAQVYVVDVREAAAKETVAEIEADGGVAFARALDVTDLVVLRALFDEVGGRHGLLHALWNHAGTPGPAGTDVSEEAWALNVDVNLKSAFFGAAYAKTLLTRADGRGAVLFTSSVSGLVGSPYSPAYSMVKGGIATMTKALALSFAPLGIRVNAVCPGPVQTPMLASFLDRDDPESVDPERIAAFAAQAVPLGRSAAPEEVARVALFLLCDDSSYITGVPLPVDGGLTAR